MRATLRDWALPFVAVLGVVAALFFATYALDYAYYRPPYGYFFNLFVGDGNTLRYSLTAVAQSLAAALGLMTAIVLVIVQLSANRYTPKIMESFTHNRVNLSIFFLFIVTIVYALWVANSIHKDFVPQFAALAVMTLMTACFALVIPYFLFVFRILSPHHIVAQLRAEAVEAIRQAHANPSRHHENRPLVVRRIEQIADIATSCIDHMDEEISRHCVRALQSVVQTYQREKEAFHEEWHAIAEEQEVGSPRRLVEEVVRRHAWVEFRALRQLRIMYRHASGRLPEIGSMIAQALRSIGVASAEKRDLPVLEIVVMFFNSLVRSAVAMKDSRACGDTLYQYRLLAEKILEVQPGLAVRVVTYFTYYAGMLLEVEIRQTFDSVAYDIRKLVERAYKNESGSSLLVTATLILDQFLEMYDRLDRERFDKQARSLMKHYVSLASFLITHGEDAIADRILDRLTATPVGVIRDLVSEIESVTDPLFWEISDRVINFNFVPPDQRKALAVLLERFELTVDRRLT